MTSESTPPPAPPSGDPVRDILVKLYDVGLKFVFSRSVPLRVKAGLATAAYALFSGSTGTYNGIQTHLSAEQFSDETLNLYAYKALSPPALKPGQCYYVDQTKKISLVFREVTLEPVVGKIMEAASLGTVESPIRDHELGDMPSISAADCTKINPDSVLKTSADAEIESARIKAAFIEGLKAQQSHYKSLQSAIGFFVVKP